MPTFRYEITVDTLDHRPSAAERLQAILEREVWLKFGDVAHVTRLEVPDEVDTPVRWWASTTMP